VTGTIWDGLYTGAGSFPGGNIGQAPGATLIADANVTGAGRLTVQSVNTGWENAEDDGFFLFKNVQGDFQMSVHVVSPFAATMYNTAGLMVRAAEPNGAPLNGAENSVSLTRFDQFGVGNYIRNTTNGQTVPMTLPADSNYWLRIDRVDGTTFNFYQKALASDPWQLIGSTVERPDFAGLTLQVGIEHASFSSMAGQAQFESFSLVVIPEPGAATLVCGGLAVMGLAALKRRQRQ
jgi:regulation of enolase protein 1 (concanavalin A-like superfamily)